MTNAFDWKKFTDEEHAKKGGDPFKQIKYNAKVSRSISMSVQKLQDKNPYHGTIIGLSTKADESIFADRRRNINRSLIK
jgi:hypothetical protein